MTESEDIRAYLITIRELEKLLTAAEGQIMQLQDELLESKRYPCEKCGKDRSKENGGMVFTVCDECWDGK